MRKLSPARLLPQLLPGLRIHRPRGPSMGGLFDNTLEGFERSQGYQTMTTDPLGFQTSFRKPVIEEGEIVGHGQIDART